MDLPIHLWWPGSHPISLILHSSYKAEEILTWYYTVGPALGSLMSTCCENV
jgi:hypothetical protein